MPVLPNFPRNICVPWKMIFEHYGRLLSTNLPVYLRKNVQVEVVNSEAVTYSEFSNALSNPVLLGIVNFAPLKGNIILEMASNSWGMLIVEPYASVAEEILMDKVREFSEIELLIIERIMIVCVNHFAGTMGKRGGYSYPG